MKPSVTIGVCCGGTLRIEMVQSLIAALFYMAEHGQPCNIWFQSGGYVDVNRNVIIDEAIKAKSTHLLFIDNDMIFPKEAIMTLLKHDKDIVGGNYNARLEPTSKSGGGSTVKGFVDGEIVSMVKLPKKLFQAYAIPTGFMMIRLDALKAMEKPYFEAWIEQAKNRHWTEDVYFCHLANQAGIKVWCDPTIKIGHVGNAIY